MAPVRLGRLRIAVSALLAACVIAAAARFVFAALYPGPRQPIPFSHRIHAATKQINCFFCHPSAARSSNAGLPPVEKCLLCHSVIASQFPPISKISDYYMRGKGMPWVRVNRLPDHVHFTHQAHVATGRFDCSRCHGDVREMDRVKIVHKFDMNFCVTCHRKNKAPVDCFTCHY